MYVLRTLIWLTETWLNKSSLTTKLFPIYFFIMCFVLIANLVGTLIAVNNNYKIQELRFAFTVLENKLVTARFFYQKILRLLYLHPRKSYIARLYGFLF